MRAALLGGQRGRGRWRVRRHGSSGLRPRCVCWSTETRAVGPCRPARARRPTQGRLLGCGRRRPFRRNVRTSCGGPDEPGAQALAGETRRWKRVIDQHRGDEGRVKQTRCTDVHRQDAAQTASSSGARRGRQSAERVSRHLDMPVVDDPDEVRVQRGQDAWRIVVIPRVGQPLAYDAGIAAHPGVPPRRIAAAEALSAPVEKQFASAYSSMTSECSSGASAAARSNGEVGGYVGRAETGGRQEVGRSGSTPAAYRPQAPAHRLTGPESAHCRSRPRWDRMAARRTPCEERAMAAASEIGLR